MAGCLRRMLGWWRVVNHWPDLQCYATRSQCSETLTWRAPAQVQVQVQVPERHISLLSQSSGAWQGEQPSSRSPLSCRRFSHWRKFLWRFCCACCSNYNRCVTACQSFCLNGWVMSNLTYHTVAYICQAAHSFNFTSVSQYKSGVKFSCYSYVRKFHR